MSRPSVILVHGMWSDFTTWGETPARLEAAGWHVIPYDLPEHGKRRTSDAALKSHGLRRYAEDLARLVSEQTEPPIVIGHSMGGFLALKAAEEGNVAGVFMITPAGAAGGFPFSLTNLVFFTRPLTMQLLGARPFRPTRWESDFALCNAAKREDRAAIHASLQNESPWPLLQLAYWFVNPGGAAFIKWDRIRAPVRMYLGGRDRIIPRYFPLAARSKLKDFAVETDPEAGHMVFAEPARDRFFAWLLSELDAINGAANRHSRESGNPDFNGVASG